MANKFDDVKLSPEQYRILVAVRKKQISNYTGDKYDTDLRELKKHSLIDYENNPESDEYLPPVPIYSSCTITQTGKDYINYHRDGIVNIKAPIIISVIALIVSIIALFQSCSVIR